MLFVIIDNEVIMGFKKRFCFFFLLFFSQCCHCNLTHEWWVLPWQATLIYMFALIILSEETNKNSLWKKKNPMSQWYVKNNPKLITQMEIKIFKKILSVTVQGVIIPYVGYLCLVFFHPPTYVWTISLPIFCGMESRAWQEK